MKRHLTVAAAVALAAVTSACDEVPTATVEPSQPQAAEIVVGPHASSTAGLVNSNAPFRNWHQGFDHGTEGWYGKDQPGELGWCGTIERVDRRGSGVQPSAGRAYAVVAQDLCNELWGDAFTDPELGTPLGLPWSPGPGFAAIGRPMPASGYTVELDIYLDPDSYVAVPPPAGTYVQEFPTWSGAVIGYSVSFMTLDDGAFHYLWAPVMEGDGSLVVNGHEVTDAGWYTFRFVFGDDGGDLTVTFELADRRGRTLMSEIVDETFFVGDDPSGYAASNVATGYAWFTSVSTGLELPIDEYRVRPGR